MVYVRGGFRVAPYAYLDHRAVKPVGIASHERFVSQQPHGIQPPVFQTNRGFRRSFGPMSSGVQDVVMARSGAVVYSELDGRAHVVPVQSLSNDYAEAHNPYGLDSATQTLRTENVDGDDEADEEDDEVEMLYE